MNHDMTHCSGYYCPLRDDCLRYKAHKELENLGIKTYFYYYCDPNYNPTTKTCKNLWKEE